VHFGKFPTGFDMPFTWDLLVKIRGFMTLQMWGKNVYSHCFDTIPAGWPEDRSPDLIFVFLVR